MKRAVAAANIWRQAESQRTEDHVDTGVIDAGDRRWHDRSTAAALCAQSLAAQ